MAAKKNGNGQDGKQQLDVLLRVAQQIETLTNEVKNGFAGVTNRLDTVTNKLDRMESVLMGPAAKRGADHELRIQTLEEHAGLRSKKAGKSES
jgi:hypothetical protein